MTAIDSHTEKIAKLLNQAERAGTEAEGATFLAKAQELATLHSIDLARARHATVAKQRSTPVQRTITLGVRGTRGLNTLVSLFQGVAHANDLQFNIAHNSTYVVAFGFAEDIDAAEALFASLTVQMAQAVDAYKKQGHWRDQVAWVERYDPDLGYRREFAVPQKWLSARLDFQAGFAHRVGQRLWEARQAAKCRAQAETTGTELVLVEKRAAVEDFYGRTSNARGHYRGHRRIANHATYRDGDRAGARARLSADTEIGGARGELAS